MKRTTANEEWWQVYGVGGELVAEYRAGSTAMTATKEYGYRGGELLVTMASGDDGRVKRFVTNLYYGALQRDPTTAELTDKSNQLADAGAQGQSQLLVKAQEIVRSLFTSTSYETTNGRSDTQYVSDLYYAYLQRAPDDSGLGWWAPQAASSRVNVCNAFEASGEFATLVNTLYGIATSDNERTERVVNDFYLGAMGRNATSVELQQQRDALNTAAAQGQSSVQTQAETMGRSLFAAQVTDLNIPAQQYVTNLYEGFLQRGPDAGGLSFWTGQAGSTSQARQNVLNAFATSVAFRELSGTLYRETFWLVGDHLGTPRMVVDRSGSLAGVKRHDYLPFGEEVGAGVGGRTTSQGYSQVDNVRQQFVGKERDNETGLDYFGARYYASVQGRFTSVDPLMASANVADPQSWNRYTYAGNNPLKYVDPEGLKKTPVFQAYEDIYDDQRRILENSSITVGKGKNAQTLSGQALYDHLAKNDPKALANFVNQTASLMNVQVMINDHMGHPVFASGASLVHSVTEIKQDRIKANVSPLLKDAVEIAGLYGLYTGPENSGGEHGIYNVSFRDNVKEGSQQLSFASSLGFAKADIDIDYCNPYAGGGLCHAKEVMQNKIFGTRTEPYKVYELLQKRPDLAIKPNYKIVEQK